MYKILSILGINAMLAIGSAFQCQWSGKVFTKPEMDLICQTVSCEANTQDFETQYMVALTIFNRLESGMWGDTVSDVLFYPNAYVVTEWHSFYETDYSGTTWEAVLFALEENNHPENMYYFRTSYYHKFGQPYTISDDLYFSTEY